MSSQVVLYACSKCFTRHPFEELSHSQQLCKVCDKTQNAVVSKASFVHIRSPYPFVELSRRQVLLLPVRVSTHWVSCIEFHRVWSEMHISVVVIMTVEDNNNSAEMKVGLK